MPHCCLFSSTATVLNAGAPAGRALAKGRADIPLRANQQPGCSHPRGHPDSFQKGNKRVLMVRPGARVRGPFSPLDTPLPSACPKPHTCYFYNGRLPKTR